MVIWVVIALLAGSKFVIYERTGGILTPNLPSEAIVFLEAIFGSFVILVFLAIIKDLVAFTLILLKRFTLNHRYTLKPHRGRISVFILVLSLSLGFLGTLSQFKVPNIKHEEIRINNLGPGLENFKIVQLSDLHIGPILEGKWLEDVVRRVNEQSPDLVVITGDFVDGTVNQLRREFIALGDLRPRFGVFAVTGNHEYYSGGNAWVRTIERFNVHFLKNQSVVIQKNNSYLALSGVPDPKGVMFGDPAPNVQKALASISRDPRISARILLAHEPNIMADRPNVDLVLTGHTHGGTMFFLKPLIAAFNEGYVSGLYEEGDTKLYVSNGTGIWAGFSTRLFVPAEITVFTLKRR